jgi:glycine dehydrogenase subunit 2
MELIFEKSVKNHRCTHLPKLDVPLYELDSSVVRDTPFDLVEIAEIDLVRHYTKLSKESFGVDDGFYPLGSCTMKYNPKINESVVALKGFTDINPTSSEQDVQGAMEVLYECEKALNEVTGMDHMSFQPGAGAHGEFSGLLMIKKYHQSRGDFNRTKIIVPDSAHGTNPASAAMNGFSVITIPSKEGVVDLDELDKVLDDSVAGLMLTNPNTLGLYDKGILKITEKVHSVGGLCYYDGANLNAIMGICKPGAMGFDCIHLNLHKTFSTPHGGGGPGVGACGCKDFLYPYLLNPRVVKNKAGEFEFENSKLSVGKVTQFYGNFLIVVRTLTYIKHLGCNGLREVSEYAVLNANYLRFHLKDIFDEPFDNNCMHEFVLDLSSYKKKYGVRAIDICKRMIDFGIHPPTMYFPLIIHEALMFEPTETESKQTLDKVVEILKVISNEAKAGTVDLTKAPFTKYYKRMDEVRAAREPILRYIHE